MPRFDLTAAATHDHPAVRRLASLLASFAADRQFTIRWPEQTTPAPVQAAAGDPYRVLLAPINVPSDDGRVIVDTLGWREPPLPFMASDSEMGHGDAIHVGALDEFARDTVDGDDWLVGTLRYDGDEDAAEYERLATDPDMAYNGVSIHMGKGEFFPVVFRDGKWQRITFDEIVEAIDGAETEDEVEAFLATILSGAFDAEVAAATQVAIPAFPGSRIIVASGGPTNPVMNMAPWIRARFDDQADTDGTAWTDTLTASTGDVDLNRPPADWFQHPGLEGPTPLTVTDDGRIYGHLALWDTCHTGYRGQCVTLGMTDTTDFAAFLQCSVTADTGDVIATGPLVVDEGHAPDAWPMARAMRHYSKTDLTAGYVTVGPDQHGVWVAGAVSPRATASQVETLRRHPLSGDWRDDGGRYRLVAAVSVNNPGFPVRDTVLVAAVGGQETPVGAITVGPTPEGYEGPSDLTLVAAAVEHGADNLGKVIGLYEALAEQVARIEEVLTRPEREAAAAALAEAFAD